MLSLFRNRGVGAKIGMGYAMVTLVLIEAVATTIRQFRCTAEVTNRVVDLRVPTAQASLGMLNEMNHSLAALRRWMILSKDKFKDERAMSWSEEIEPSMATMKEFTVSEVLDITGENVDPPPSMGGSVDTSFILGMGKVGDAVKILLDINKVLTSEELLDVASVASTAESTVCAVESSAQLL